MRKNRYVQSRNTIVERCQDGTFRRVVMFMFTWEAVAACKALNKAWREKEKRCGKTCPLRPTAAR